MTKQRKAPTAQDTRKAFMAPLKDLILADNPRQDYDPAAMRELMVSMRHNGCMEPVLVHVTPKGMRLVGGYRRFAAAQKLGWDVIDAIEIDADDEIDEMLKRLAENIIRTNPSLPEQGRQFAAIIKTRRLTATEIAARIGCSKEYVDKAIHGFGFIPKQFHDRITYGTRGNLQTKGTIPATVALSIADLRKDTPRVTQADTEKLMKWASEKGVNIIKTRTAARMISAGVPVSKAIERVDYMRTITLSFVMNINKIKQLQHKYEMDIHDILYTVLEAQEELGITASAAKKRSGKTPSALLVKKQIKRKAPKR